MPSISRFFFWQIYLFSLRCFSSLFLCRETHGHSFLSQISRTCHTQASCCCSRFNLDTKRTVFVDKAVDNKEYYVRGIWRCSGVAQSGCIIAATFFSIRIYMSVRLHVNEIQVLQLQHTPQNAQMVNVRRLRKFAMMSVYVCFVLTVCYLPNICTLFAIAFTSRRSTGIKHLQFYTLTLEFLNSSLNPVIYCWKMKHIRHTIIGLIRNAFTKQN